MLLANVSERKAFEKANKKLLQKIYFCNGTTKEDIENALQTIDRIKKELSFISNLSENQLFSQKHLVKMKTKNFSCEIRNLNGFILHKKEIISEISDKIEDYRQSIARKIEKLQYNQVNMTTKEQHKYDYNKANLKNLKSFHKKLIKSKRKIFILNQRIDNIQETLMNIETDILDVDRKMLNSSKNNKINSNNTIDTDLMTNNKQRMKNDCDDMKPVISLEEAKSIIKNQNILKEKQRIQCKSIKEEERKQKEALRLNEKNKVEEMALRLQDMRRKESSKHKKENQDEEKIQINNEEPENKAKLSSITKTGCCNDICVSSGKNKDVKLDEDEEMEPQITVDNTTKVLPDETFDSKEDDKNNLCLKNENDSPNKPATRAEENKDTNETKKIWFYKKHCYKCYDSHKENKFLETPKQNLDLLNLENTVPEELSSTGDEELPFKNAITETDKQIKVKGSHTSTPESRKYKNRKHKLNIGKNCLKPKQTEIQKKKPISDEKPKETIYINVETDKEDIVKVDVSNKSSCRKSICCKDSKAENNKDKMDHDHLTHIAKDNEVKGDDTNKRQTESSRIKNEKERKIVSEAKKKDVLLNSVDDFSQKAFDNDKSMCKRCIFCQDKNIDKQNSGNEIETEHLINKDIQRETKSNDIHHKDVPTVVIEEYIDKSKDALLTNKKFFCCKNCKSKMCITKIPLETMKDDSKKDTVLNDPEETVIKKERSSDKESYEAVKKEDKLNMENMDRKQVNEDLLEKEKKNYGEFKKKPGGTICTKPTCTCCKNTTTGKPDEENDLNKVIEVPKDGHVSSGEIEKQVEQVTEDVTKSKTTLKKKPCEGCTKPKCTCCKSTVNEKPQKKEQMNLNEKERKLENENDLHGITEIRKDDAVTSLPYEKSVENVIKDNDLSEKEKNEKSAFKKKPCGICCSKPTCTCCKSTKTEKSEDENVLNRIFDIPKEHPTGKLVEKVTEDMNLGIKETYTKPVLKKKPCESCNKPKCACCKNTKTGRMHEQNYLTGKSDIPNEGGILSSPNEKNIEQINEDKGLKKKNIDVTFKRKSCGSCSKLKCTCCKTNKVKEVQEESGVIRPTDLLKDEQVLSPPNQKPFKQEKEDLNLNEQEKKEEIGSKKKPCGICCSKPTCTCCKSTKTEKSQDENVLNKIIDIPKENPTVVPFEKVTEDMNLGVKETYTKPELKRKRCGSCDKPKCACCKNTKTGRTNEQNYLTGKSDIPNEGGILSSPNEKNMEQINEDKGLKKRNIDVAIKRKPCGSCSKLKCTCCKTNKVKEVQEESGVTRQTDILKDEQVLSPPNQKPFKQEKEDVNLDEKEKKEEIGSRKKPCGICCSKPTCTCCKSTKTEKAEVENVLNQIIDTPKEDPTVVPFETVTEDMNLGIKETYTKPGLKKKRCGSCNKPKCTCCQTIKTKEVENKTEIIRPTNIPKDNCVSSLPYQRNEPKDLIKEEVRFKEKNDEIVYKKKPCKTICTKPKCACSKCTKIEKSNDKRDINKTTINVKTEKAETDNIINDEIKVDRLNEQHSKIVAQEYKPIITVPETLQKKPDDKLRSKKCLCCGKTVCSRRKDINLENRTQIKRSASKTQSLQNIESNVKTNDKNLFGRNSKQPKTICCKMTSNERYDLKERLNKENLKENEQEKLGIEKEESHIQDEMVEDSPCCCKPKSRVALNNIRNSDDPKLTTNVKEDVKTKIDIKKVQNETTEATTNVREDLCCKTFCCQSEIKENSVKIHSHEEDVSTNIKINVVQPLKSNTIPIKDYAPIKENQKGLVQTKTESHSISNIPDKSIKKSSCKCCQETNTKDVQSPSRPLKNVSDKKSEHKSQTTTIETPKSIKYSETVDEVPNIISKIDNTYNIKKEKVSTPCTNVSELSQCCNEKQTDIKPQDTESEVSKQFKISDKQMKEKNKEDISEISKTKSYKDGLYNLGINEPTSALNDGRKPSLKDNQCCTFCKTADIETEHKVLESVAAMEPLERPTKPDKITQIKNENMEKYVNPNEKLINNLSKKNEHKRKTLENYEVSKTLCFEEKSSNPIKIMPEPETRQTIDYPKEINVKSAVKAKSEDENKLKETISNKERTKQNVYNPVVENVGKKPKSKSCCKNTKIEQEYDLDINPKTENVQKLNQKDNFPYNAVQNVTEEKEPSKEVIEKENSQDAIKENKIDPEIKRKKTCCGNTEIEPSNENVRKISEKLGRKEEKKLAVKNKLKEALRLEEEARLEQERKEIEFILSETNKKLKEEQLVKLKLKQYIRLRQLEEERKILKAKCEEERKFREQNRLQEKSKINHIYKQRELKMLSNKNLCNNTSSYTANINYSQQLLKQRDEKLLIEEEHLKEMDALIQFQREELFDFPNQKDTELFQSEIFERIDDIFNFKKDKLINFGLLNETNENKMKNQFSLKQKNNNVIKDNDSERDFNFPEEKTNDNEIEENTSEENQNNQSSEDRTASSNTNIDKREVCHISYKRKSKGSVDPENKTVDIIARENTKSEKETTKSMEIEDKMKSTPIDDGKRSKRCCACCKSTKVSKGTSSIEVEKSQKKNSGEKNKNNLNLSMEKTKNKKLKENIYEDNRSNVSSEDRTTSSNTNIDKREVCHISYKRKSKGLMDPENKTDDIIVKENIKSEKETMKSMEIEDKRKSTPIDDGKRSKRCCACCKSTKVSKETSIEKEEFQKKNTREENKNNLNLSIEKTNYNKSNENIYEDNRSNVSSDDRSSSTNTNIDKREVCHITYKRKSKSSVDQERKSIDIIVKENTKSEKEATKSLEVEDKRKSIPVDDNKRSKRCCVCCKSTKVSKETPVIEVAKSQEKDSVEQRKSFQSKGDESTKVENIDDYRMEEDESIYTDADIQKNGLFEIEPRESNSAKNISEKIVKDVPIEKPIIKEPKEPKPKKKKNYEYFNEDIVISNEATDVNDSLTYKDEEKHSSDMTSENINVSDSEFQIPEDDPNNYKFWPTYIYKIRQENNKRKVGCVLKAKPGCIGRRKNIECNAIEPTRVLPNIDLREDAASVPFQLKPTSDDIEFNFDNPWKIIIPHILPKNSTKDAVILMLSEDETEWIELPTSEIVIDELKDQKLRFVEAKLEKPSGIFIVQTKTKVDSGIINKHGARIASSLDGRVFISVPPGAIRITLNTSLKVNTVDTGFWKELKGKFDKSPLEQVVSCSHLIDFAAKKKKLIKPATISCYVPLNPEAKKQQEAQTKASLTKRKETNEDEDDDESNIDKQNKTSTPRVELSSFQKSLLLSGLSGANANESIRVMRFSNEDDKWIEMEKTELTMDKTKEQISLEFPTIQSEKFFMLRASRTITLENLTKSVKIIDKEFSIRNAIIILLKSSKDPYEFLLLTCLKSRSEKILAQLKDDGYNIEPQNSPVPIELKERQIITTQFSGNIQHVQKEKNTLSFAFQSLFQNIQIFQTKAIDPYAQRAIDHYRGYIMVITNKLVKKQIESTDKKARKGLVQYQMVEEEVTICQLLISIPKKRLTAHKPLRSTPFNRNILEDYMGLLTRIAQSIGVSWKELGAALKISESRLQSLKHHNPGSQPSKIAIQMLLFWLKGLELKDDKPEILRQALLEINRNDIAVLMQESTEEDDDDNSLSITAS